MSNKYHRAQFAISPHLHPKPRIAGKIGLLSTGTSYDRFYHDYGATAHVDTRLKQFGRETMAFVFMYTDRHDQERVIADVLDSIETEEQDTGG